MTNLPGRLLVVADNQVAATPIESIVENVLQAGGKWIWLRHDETLAQEQLETLAVNLLNLCVAHQAILSIGNNMELARRIGARAVHLNARQNVTQAREMLGPSCLIGQSTHSVPEAVRARDAGADYVTLSPIFESSSKPGYGPALGLKAIEDASRQGVKVAALGGVGIKNARSCFTAGAAAVAMMGEILHAADVGASVRQCLSSDQ